jgi:hypothetical protein
LWNVISYIIVSSFIRLFCFIPEVGTWWLMTINALCKFVHYQNQFQTPDRIANRISRSRDFWPALRIKKLTLWQIMAWQIWFVPGILKRERHDTGDKYFTIIMPNTITLNATSIDIFCFNFVNFCFKKKLIYSKMFHSVTLQSKYCIYQFTDPRHSRVLS